MGVIMKIIFLTLLIQIGFTQETYEDFTEDEEEFYQGEDINYDAFNESDLEILLENNDSNQNEQIRPESPQEFEEEDNSKN